MRGLSKTLSSLRQNSRGVLEALKIAAEALPSGVSGPASSSATRLTRVADFGSNPGQLGMLTYVPEGLPPLPALVVVLHGCTQTPAGYNDGSGWSALADRYGFVLLFPEQSQANNPKACFNWFQPTDNRRGAGEASSIRQMIDRAMADHGVDPARVFVTGLSAGGAMAAVMLATYPEVFAAGAVIAGLPYGGASTVQGALEMMFQGRPRSASQWGDLVRAASPHRGPWPRLSVWHGSADRVVKPDNAAELLKQWTNLHGVSGRPTLSVEVDGQVREVWRDASGQDVVESFVIPGLGHGTPLAVGTGEMKGGAAGAFMLEAGISSSHHIAAFFGLTGETEPASAPNREATRRAAALDGEVLPPAPPEGSRAAPIYTGPVPLPESLPTEVLAVIQKAFKTAGLIKS